MLRRVNDGRKSFEEWYSRLPENKRDTTHYNLRRAYELAPREQLDSFVNDPNAHLYSSYLNPETENALLDWQNKNKPKSILDKATRLDRYSKNNY